MSVKNKTITRELSLWFQKNARTLPWRSRPEPYRVWLSEVMLQQTKVATVIPYFQKFISEFPSVQHLAQARLEAVYALWAGLGYYSRARNLHRGAIAISERIQQGLGFPQNREEWLLIPGVGEYTAGAICSIALNQYEPLVDGNVVRVLSRIFGIKKIDAKKTLIWNHARTLVNQPGVKPSVFNQSLMELGALICRPQNPKCNDCPVKQCCKGSQNPEQYPEPKKKKEWKKVQEQKWLLFCEGKVYLEENKKGFWREGLWDFPNAGSLSEIKKAQMLSSFTVKYVVTNHKVERQLTVLKITSSVKNKLTRATGAWYEMSALPAVPATVKKTLVKNIEKIYGGLT